MRDLKFRVWLHDSKEWGDVVCLEVFDSTGKLEYLYQDQPYTIQQYTGLKDKNGKEIYEGDVISGKYCHSSDVKNVVRYYDGAFNISSEYWQKDSLIVLGNIFETSELIQ